MQNQVSSYIYFDEERELHINLYETSSGEPCRYYILNDPVSKQAAAYASMKSDLMRCKNYLEYLKSINHIQQIPQIVKTSLLFTSIILYGRCFNSAEGRGTTLQKNGVFRGEREIHSDFHDKTIEIRNGYLAHAGNSKLESRAMVLVLNPDIENKKIETINYAGIRLKDDDSNLDNYTSLFSTVISHVDEKIGKLSDIIRKKVSEMDIEDIYKNSNLPDKSKFIPFDVSVMKK